MKIGDKVKCINCKDAPFLTQNKIYTIWSIDGKYLYLERTTGMWLQNRFELVT